MKLGLGLYRHMLNDEYYSFAVQAGCTHVVIHLVDYFRQGEANPNQNQPTGTHQDGFTRENGRSQRISGKISGSRRGGRGFRGRPRSNGRQRCSGRR